MPYKSTSSWPKRLSDGAFVNPDSDAEYLAWVAAGGVPLPADVTPWSREPLLKVVKAGREIALNRLAGIAFAAREDGDSATVEACLAARQSLLDITKLPAVLAATDDASLTAAIGAGYAAIVGACPANIVSAFAGIQT